MTRSARARYPNLTVRRVEGRPGWAVVHCSTCNWARQAFHKNALARHSIAFGMGVAHTKEKHLAARMPHGIQ